MVRLSGIMKFLDRLYLKAYTWLLVGAGYSGRLTHWMPIPAAPGFVEEQ